MDELNGEICNGSLGTVFFIFPRFCDCKRYKVCHRLLTPCDTHFYHCMGANNVEKSAMTYNKGALMTDSSIRKECSDPTQSLTLEIPCGLAERIDRYARENGSTLTGVMIEALDAFLRKPE